MQENEWNFFLRDRGSLVLATVLTQGRIYVWITTHWWLVPAMVISFAYWIWHRICSSINNPESKGHGAYMGSIWADRIQLGPMLAPWILLSGKFRLTINWWFERVVIFDSRIIMHYTSPVCAGKSGDSHCTQKHLLMHRYLESTATTHELPTQSSMVIVYRMPNHVDEMKCVGE